MITFEELYQEITDINKIEPKNVERKMIKFAEEYGEMSAEYNKFLGETYKEYERRINKRNG